MARATMATLISFVRDRIGDPSGASAVFTDDQIQTALDATRYDITTPEVLIPVYSYSSGVIVWLDHYSQNAFWEDSPVLLNFGLQVISPTLSELLREPDPDGKAAHWQFATTQLGVRAMGHSFDVWGTCANLLEQKIISQAALNINVNAGGSSFSLYQITQTMYQMVALYRSKQRIGSLRAVRDDVGDQRQWERAQQVGIVAAGIPFLTGQ